MKDRIATVLSVALGIGAAGAAAPAGADTPFANFHTFNNPKETTLFAFSGDSSKKHGHFSITPKSDPDVHFTFDKGILAGDTIDATLLFSATETSLDALGKHHYDAEFDNISMDFKADKKYTFTVKGGKKITINKGDSVLDVSADTADLNFIATYTKKNGKTVVHRGSDFQSDEAAGATITYASAYLPVFNGVDTNAFDMHMLNTDAKSGYRVTKTDFLKAFTAAGGGDFVSAPVPELGSLVSFGGLILGGGLLGLRRRKR